MTFTELQNLVQKQQTEIQDLKNKVAQLTLKEQQQNDFQTEFSGRTIINKEIQFKQKVYRKDGSLVSQINA